MFTGVFLVFVGNAQRVQACVQGAVSFDKKVIHAAVEAEGGARDGVGLLCQREDVVRAARGRVPEDGPPLASPVVFAGEVAARKVQRPPNG